METKINKKLEKAIKKGAVLRYRLEKVEQEIKELSAYKYKTEDCCEAS